MPFDRGLAAAPDACTLPTPERPMRLAEFDDLFATAVTWQDRPDATTLRLGLTPDPDVAARTANLVVRESECCAFFTFSLAVTGDRLRLDVTVPETYIEVLDALAERVGPTERPADAGVPA